MGCVGGGEGGGVLFFPMWTLQMVCTPNKRSNICKTRSKGASCVFKMARRLNWMDWKFLVSYRNYQHFWGWRIRSKKKWITLKTRSTTWDLITARNYNDRFLTRWTILKKGLGKVILVCWQRVWKNIFNK